VVTDGYEYSYPVPGELCVLPPYRSRCRLFLITLLSEVTGVPSWRFDGPAADVTRPGARSVPLSWRKFMNLVTKVGAGTAPFARTFRGHFSRRGVRRVGAAGGPAAYAQVTRGTSGWLAGPRAWFPRPGPGR
jgi:hypothetical protein